MSWNTGYAYIDNSLDVARRVSLPVLALPIPGQNYPYVLTEDWEQLLLDQTDWQATALNTLHPEYSLSQGASFDYYLVSESPLRDLGGGRVRWTKTFAAVPSTHNEYKMFGYNLVGITGVWGVNVSSVSGRDRRLWNLKSRIQHDYFLVGTGGSYASESLIPDNRAFQYCYGAGVANTGNIGLPVDFTFDFTCPTTAALAIMVANAANSGWSSTVVPQTISSAGIVTMSATPTGGQIIAEDSSLERWQGNIWLRTTRYVLAQ